MKVVQKGSLTKRTTCTRCKSELEYEPEDVKSMSYEDSATTYYVQCPICVPKLGEGYSFVYVKNPGTEAAS